MAAKVLLGSEDGGGGAGTGAEGTLALPQTVLARLEQVGASWPAGQAVDGGDGLHGRPARPGAYA